MPQPLRPSHTPATPTATASPRAARPLAAEFPDDPTQQPAPALLTSPRPGHPGRHVRLHALTQWFRLPITRDQHAFISGALYPPRPEEIW